nr:MAG TPA: hypothetical protein [Caudoviricetes sp.]DAT69901.1 MAG TPA: hypothetical protein [Caudoviricetes sp.]
MQAYNSNLLQLKNLTLVRICGKMMVLTIIQRKF